MIDKDIKKIKNRALLSLKSLKVSLSLNKYYKEPLVISNICSNPNNRDYCELVVVSFNNSKVISYQIKSLKNFFLYPFRYTVFDNSTDETKAKEILEICTKENIRYVKLPHQHFLPKGMVSYSHGIALNYIFRNYINKYSNAEYLGVLDHDIFCVEQFDISRYLKEQPYYGLVHHRSCNPSKIKYIWPGFAFYRAEYIHSIELDFRPSIRLAGDTGVRLYESVYSKSVIDIDKLNMVKEEHRFLDNSHNVANAGYSFFSSGWIHCWNASNYMELNGMHDKMKAIYNYLDNIFEK